MNTLPTSAQRHMRIIPIILGIFVVINIAIFIRFFSSNRFATLSPLFPYVSAQAQQAVLVQSESLLQLLGDDA